MNGDTCLTDPVIVCIDIWYNSGEGSLCLTVIVALFTNCALLCVCVFACALPNRFLDDVPELTTAVIGSCCNIATSRTNIKCRRYFPLPQQDQSHRIRSHVVNTQFSLLAFAFEPISHLIFSSACWISPNSIMFRCMTSVISLLYCYLPCCIPVLLSFIMFLYNI